MPKPGCNGVHRSSLVKSVVIELCFTYQMFWNIAILYVPCLYIVPMSRAVPLLEALGT